MSEMVNCYECGKKFVLREDHLVNYNDSSLCPDCYGKIMGELHNPKAGIEARLDVIIDVLSEIREELRNDKCLPD